MAHDFPVSTPREYDDNLNSHLLNVFETPRTNTTIVKSQYVRAEIASPLSRMTKLSTNINTIKR